MSQRNRTSTVRLKDGRPLDIEIVVSGTSENTGAITMADTEIRPFPIKGSAIAPFNAEATAISKRPTMRAFTPAPSRIRLRRALGIFAIMLCLSATLVIFLLPGSKMVSRSAPSQAVKFNVSAIDPAMQADAAAKVDAKTASEVNPVAMDKLTQKKGPVLNLNNRTFSYAREPRISQDGSYASAASDSAPAAGSRVRAARLGLRPLPDGNGRFLSRSGLEWQGRWEPNNPAGNITRGENYLKYLRSQFSTNMEKSLAARETGLSTFNPKLPGAAPAEAPILKYSK